MDWSVVLGPAVRVKRDVKTRESVADIVSQDEPRNSIRSHTLPYSVSNTPTVLSKPPSFIYNLEIYKHVI